jgi:hypothetical protein
VLLATHLPITQLAAGDRHVVATLPDGTVYTWGDNLAEQLGGSTTNFRALAPLIVPRLTGMSGIAAGAFHSLTRYNSCGTLWSWGRNLQGQLGHGEVSVSQGQPLPVYGLGEASLGEGCEVGLRVWQLGSGTISTADDDFGAGGCDLAYCGAPVTRDRVVQITATPAEGFEFERWVGDCTGVNPTATLTINESKNCIAVYGRVAAVDEPLVANIAYSPTNPVAGEQVTFDGSARSDDSAISSYEWDLDNDGVFESMGVTTTHTFPTEGLYSLHLRVTDDGGQTNVATVEVTVNPTVGGNVTLTLTFLGGGSGRVTSSVGGLDCTSTCSVDVAPGTEVFLSPMPFGGSVFSHWGVDPTDPPTSDCDQDFGIEGCSLTMDGDRTVRVYFE